MNFSKFSSCCRCQLKHVLLIAAVLVGLGIYVGLPLVTPHVSAYFGRYESTSNRRILAKELQTIHLRLVGHVMKKKPPPRKLLMEFEAIIHRLDSRIPQSIQKRVTTKRKEVLDVCPEVYKGSKEGYPYYQKGWETLSCTNVKPIESVVTILINTLSYSKTDFNQVDFILNGIEKSYPTVRVYLAALDTQKKIKRYKNVKVFRLSGNERTNVGKTWNLLVSKAETPYVLIARDIIHFSWLSQVERQIRIVSEVPDVGIAGGSYRNSSGHWKMGCYQSTMKNYVLKYKKGYFHSRNECMFCDYLQGPFVAKKSILKFDESINNEVVFEDLFLQLTTKGTLIMGCPDAMYFNTDYSYLKRTERKLWFGFAKKWILNRVLLPGGIRHSFSCKEIDFKCNNKLTHSFLLPVCCQEEYENSLATIEKFFESHNLSFELDTGSVLGTVKFNGLLPWDMDGDIALLSTPNLKMFSKESIIEHFKNHGITIVAEKPQEYIKFKLPELYIEGWPIGQLTCPQYLPNKGLQSRKTFSLVRKTWISSVFSPGLFARNRYGAEVLKHSQSWIVWKANKQKDYNAQHSFSHYKRAGVFTGCDNPGFHSCLQDFPPDGNIPFLVI